MMYLQTTKGRIGITWESLTWFAVFTMIGTVAGAMAYQWLVPYLPESITGIPPATPTTPQQPPPRTGIPGLTTES